MRRPLREDAEGIVRQAIEENLPGTAVREALRDFEPPEGRLVLVAIGKAAWRMAKEAKEVLGDALEGGLVITKYKHVMGPIEGVRCLEAGHPVVDAAGVAATQEAVALANSLGEGDLMLFLVSGGGSALFEDPAIPLAELADITRQLLARGASIDEINCVRKHLSNVKGGRFAELCAPAPVLAIALSDVLGDALDTIASGPCYPDATTSEDARAICERYGIALSDEARVTIGRETPKELDGVTTRICGSVRLLAESARRQAEERGYETCMLTSSLDCEAREAGRVLGAIARDHAKDGRDLAWIMAGETVVHLLGEGLGGRNQEFALAAAPYLRGLEGACVISVGSDGTDGPTDAAGGYVDGHTVDALAAEGLTVDGVIATSDSHHALAQIGGLVVTGATGTNVNDIALALVRGA